MKFIKWVERLLVAFAMGLCNLFGVTPDQIERARREDEGPPRRQPGGRFEA